MSKWLIFVTAVIAIIFVIYQSQDDPTDSSIDISDDGEDGTVSASIDQLASAIAAQENVADFHNNPYALTAAAAAQVGADYTPNTTGGVVVNFATLADGQAAGQEFIAEFAAKHSGLTLAQALATYIQGPNAATTISGNYPASVLNYIAGVAKALGVSASSTLGSILGQ